MFIGIETPDPKLLKTTQKMQNIPGSPLEKLARIRQHGLHVTAGFIVGFDGEDRGVFEAQRKFIQASESGWPWSACCRRFRIPSSRAD